jgi:hypothetical protein
VKEEEEEEEGGGAIRTANIQFNLTQGLLILSTLEDR